MSYSIVYPNGEAISIAVASGAAVAVKTKGTAKIYQIVGYPNIPDTRDLLLTVTNGEDATSVFTAAGTVEIEASASEVKYSIGVDAKVVDGESVVEQGAPVALNATGTLTAAMMLSGIVTSTSAAAVVATVATGAVLDLASSFTAGDSFDFTVINTGPNIFTWTAASGITIVGDAVVQPRDSATFKVRYTAADTFITYRLDSAQNETQAVPLSLNSTGTISTAMILNGIVTSTSGAGVTATLVAGATMDAAGSFDIGESFDWSVINTGGNTFTVTASSGHTLIGVGAILTVVSASFRTKKTATNTFVTYKLSQ